MKNIFKRGGTYYMRVEIQGKRIIRSLRTRNRQVAEARAKPLIAAAKKKQFAIVDACSTQATGLTIDKLLLKYAEFAKERGLGERTIRDNISALKRLIRPRHGSNTESILVASLCRATVTEYVKTTTPKNVGPDALARYRRTTKSLLRLARSPFASWALEKYSAEGIELPPLKEFLTAEGVSSKGIAKHYRRPPQDLIDNTLQAAKQLAETTEGEEDYLANQALYQVFLLSYPLALRAKESASAKRDWLQIIDGVAYCVVPLDHEFEAKNSGVRAIPIATSTYEDLLERAGDVYLINRNAHVARHNLVTREFATWMTKLGWPEGKKAHELRKLMGCRWFSEQGAEVAQEFLGHKNITVTCQLYAQYSRKVAPLQPDWA